MRESLKVRKSVRRLRARESACEGAPESDDWESVRESASSESGWDLRILEKRPVKIMRERGARDSARSESAACLRVRV